MTHRTFIVAASLSFGLTMLDLLMSGQTEQLDSMLAVVLPLAVVVLAALFLTRRYWVGAKSVDAR